MDNVLLGRIIATLVEILKARTEGRVVCLLGLAKVEPGAYGDEWYGDTVPWVFDMLLPAAAYAQLPDEEVKRAETVIRTTLAEVTRTLDVEFPVVRIAPQLVEDPGDAWREEIGRWLPALLSTERAISSRAEGADGEDEQCPF
ncbi:MAG: hypothetical protein RDU25_00155 [Patescibacteria group bacterium]|nr:hypothetical protein [Patescibacteria group bacterium]